jgi:hypothetical protein
VWFIHAECNFHTHWDFDTHECDCDTHDCWNHAQEWFLHIECDFDTYECEYDTHECDYDTHECDFNTQHKIIISKSYNPTKHDIKKIIIAFFFSCGEGRRRGS